MKNKAVLELSVGTIVTILLLFVVLILGIILVNRIFFQDKFTIYEQECYNLSNEEICQLIFGEEAIAISREGGFDCYHNLKPGEHNYSWWTPYFDTEEEINLSGELCKKVEVDEIEIKCGWFEEINETHVDLIFNCGCEFYQDGQLDFYETIPKSNLTTEWLSENCECKWYVCKNNEDYDCEIQNRIFCRKYKCGEYFVEVK